MKKNLITKGTPIVALIFLVALGMISCTSNPMSSPDDGSATYTAGAEQDAPLLPSVDNSEDHSQITKRGQLALSSAGCWILIVSPTEQLELRLTGGIPSETESMSATVIGYYEYQLQAICRQGPVFHVDDILIN